MFYRNLFTIYLIAEKVLTAEFLGGKRSSFFSALLLFMITNTLADFLAAFSVFFANIASLSAPRFPQKALSDIFAHQNGSCRIFNNKERNVLFLFLLSIKENAVWCVVQYMGGGEVPGRGGRWRGGGGEK